MADRVDRSDNETGRGGSFMLGLLAGTVFGAGLGMMFASMNAEQRSQLADKAADLAKTASEGFRKGRDAMGEWVEKGQDMYGKVREAAKSGADEAERYVRDTTSPTGGPPRG